MNCKLYKLEECGSLLVSNFRKQAKEAHKRKVEMDILSVSVFKVVATCLYLAVHHTYKYKC